MSPAGPTSLEDQQYMEKLKQLSKYIEPLRRMINKIDKNEGEPLASLTSQPPSETPQHTHARVPKLRFVEFIFGNGTLGDLKDNPSSY